MFRVEAIEQEGERLHIIRQLFSDYAKELNENLCFQSFDKELENPLLKYGPPLGSLLLGTWNGEIAACIALTPLKEDKTCEMKRLYVVPGYRKLGIGRLLVDEILKTAERIGYHTMKLDTLEKLQPAIKLYESYGFEHTTPYYTNPIGGVVYMSKTLNGSAENHFSR